MQLIQSEHAVKTHEATIVKLQEKIQKLVSKVQFSLLIFSLFISCVCLPLEYYIRICRFCLVLSLGVFVCVQGEKRKGADKEIFANLFGRGVRPNSSRYSVAV